MIKGIKGLSTEEVKKSKEKYGDNSLKQERQKGFFRKFLENLNDPIIKVLIIAVSIELIFTFRNCNFLEIGGIIAAILIATTVSTVSEYGSERAFAKLQADSIDSKVKVYRDGEILEIMPSELVVGDIVKLSSGEKIPADGILLSGSLNVDQSALNGESKEVRKLAGPDSGSWDLSATEKVFRGSVITSGDAVMRVEKVGGETYYGMVARDVQAETRESPLKLRLGILAKQISKIGYVMAALVGVTYLFNAILIENGFVAESIKNMFLDPTRIIALLLHTLTLMITVVVVAAPEGLPMMVTVVLSANMKKMLRDGVLVKKLVGIETAGSMNILFTDKTGTITTGNLECERVITAYGRFSSLGSIKKDEFLYRTLALSAKYNTDAVIGSAGAVGGNSTEKAILDFFASPELYRYKVTEKIPFTSERKYSEVTFEDGFSLMKGAPEIVLRKVKYAAAQGGGIKGIDRVGIEQSFYSEAASGGRVIAVAYRNSASDAWVFLALIVLRDRIKPTAKEAISSMKNAGIQIVMMTGDSKETALAIAKECGILHSEVSGSVLTSSELSEMSDDDVKKILPRLAVLARALPQDKTRLVRLSQELDLVVGMTGDGINDAPSLKLADIGFAMESGADIAKSASDIVIMNNDLLAINKTVLYGRTIFKSIRKFITFQLMMNLAACGTSLIGQFLGIESPITIIQMLWVNIIMDTLGGLAFAGEAPLDYYMKEKPKKRGEPILSAEMLNQIFITGGYTLFLCFVFLKSELIRGAFRYSENGIYHMTAFYAFFIFAGLFNCFGARCERLWILSSIEKNKSFVFIMILIAVIQVVMIYCGGTVFRTAPLLVKELAVAISLAFSTVPFELLRRIIYKLNS